MRSRALLGTWSRAESALQQELVLPHRAYAMGIALRALCAPYRSPTWYESLHNKITRHQFLRNGPLLPWDVIAVNDSPGGSDARIAQVSRDRLSRPRSGERPRRARSRSAASVPPRSERLVAEAATSNAHQAQERRPRIDGRTAASGALPEDPIGRSHSSELAGIGGQAPRRTRRRWRAGALPVSNRIAMLHTPSR